MDDKTNEDSFLNEQRLNPKHRQWIWIRTEMKMNLVKSDCKDCITHYSVALPSDKTSIIEYYL